MYKRLLMKNKFIKIGLDLDQVLDDFMGPYLDRFGSPRSNEEITRNVQRKLLKDREFWLNLPVINRINFVPELYCSKRVNPKNWTKQWLYDNSFPNRPLYQMYYQHGNKATMIKGKVDLFIDDSVNNFIDINKAGIPCLLMDTPYNQSSGPILRLNSLDIEEIHEVYNLGMKSGMFKNFKNIISEIK